MMPWLSKAWQTFRFDRVEAHRLSILPEDFGIVVFGMAQEGHLVRSHLHCPVNDAVQDIQHDLLTHRSHLPKQEQMYKMHKKICIGDVLGLLVDCRGNVLSFVCSSNRTYKLYYSGLHSFLTVAQCTMQKNNIPAEEIQSVSQDITTHAAWSRINQICLCSFLKDQKNTSALCILEHEKERKNRHVYFAMKISWPCSGALWKQYVFNSGSSRQRRHW